MFRRFCFLPSNPLVVCLAICLLSPIVVDSKKSVFAVDTIEDRETAKRKKITNQFGMEFVLIPSGRFVMGAHGTNGDSFPHEVELTTPFYLGVAEVTDVQVSRTRSDYRVEHEKDWGIQGEQAFDFPSFVAASKFAEHITILDRQYQYRLPTEAEWEYACTNGANENDKQNKVNQTVRGPTKATGPNKFGLYDMLNNLGEYCSDHYSADYYLRSPLKDPRGPGYGTFVVVRGLSFPKTSHTRDKTPSNGEERMDIGLRLVLELKQAVEQQSVDVQGR